MGILDQIVLALLILIDTLDLVLHQGYVLTGYIAFSYFTVLNVMTDAWISAVLAFFILNIRPFPGQPAKAVFCKRAIESAEQDEQNIMQRFHDDQRRLVVCCVSRTRLNIG